MVSLVCLILFCQGKYQEKNRLFRVVSKLSGGGFQKSQVQRKKFPRNKPQIGLVFFVERARFYGLYEPVLVWTTIFQVQPN